MDLLNNKTTPKNSPRKKNKQALIDEEELESEKIIVSLTSKYTELESSDLLGKTLEHLRENIKPGICLICIENVERDEAVWSCEKCFCLLHLVCIQRWAKDSIQNVKEAAAYKGFNLPIIWCCPKCREEYPEERFPNKYYCFCKKVQNPSPDAWSAPHSCGESCGKALKPECGHFCVLLCHSGPCPPCPKQIVSSCHCGKSEPRTLRCFSKSWSCEDVCSKSLSCDEHTCPIKCHPGECPECVVPVSLMCRCSKPRSIQYPCKEITSTSITISCGNECKKPLGCGKHFCLRICHEDDCGPCETTCPCGKERVPCLGNQSRGFGRPCGDTCGKELDCLQHFCEQKCHSGNCGSCLQLVWKKCKCGNHEKEVLCSKEFVCATKCRRMRDCGVHTCNKKCCTGDCPPCNITCGKTLQCKNHKCEMVCHKGPCFPCPVTAQAKCYCGQTVRFVPCGSEKKCQPPNCSQWCTKKSKCDHPEIQLHKCHYGDCPRCKLICGKTMSCGHTCPSVCHSLKLNRKPCFKCVKPVPSKCLVHTNVEVQCCLQDENCEEYCGLPLFCGQHRCQKRCHVKLQEDCGQCYEPCSKPRPEGCQHQCELGCHKGPCQDCTLVAKVPCHCGEETLFVTCFKQHLLSESEKSCKNQCPKKLSCGHRCLSICHSGDCPPLDRCRRKVKVTCRCRIFKKEVECFLLGDSKILECSPSTCNQSAKSPGGTSGSKGKRKPRHKKTSESHDSNGVGSNDSKEINNSAEDNLKEKGSSKKDLNVFVYVVAAVVLGIGIVFGLSSIDS